MPIDKLNSFIFKKNMLPKFLTDDIMKYEKDFEWTSHMWHNSETNTHTSHKEKELSVSYGDPDLVNVLKSFSVEAIKLYQEHINSTYPIVNHISDARLNKYETGTMMRPHFDHIHTLFDGEARGIPVLSIVGVINDDYRGGEFIFWDDYVVKLKAGDILIFPSNFMYKHRVNEVTEGTRMSFVSWAW